MKDRFGFDRERQGTFFWRRPHLSRRAFFRHLGAGVGGYFLLPARPMETVARGAATAARAKYAIFIQLNGGASHTDTFDLKTGPWLPATFNPTPFNGALFPQGLFPNLANQLGSIALVRSVRSWAAVHDLGRNWVQIGRNPAASTSRIAPHIGSVVSMELSPTNADQTLPTFLALNTGTDIPGSGYFPPQHAPFLVNPNGGGLGNTQHRDGQPAFLRRYDLLTRLDSEQRTLDPFGGGFEEVLQFNTAARALMYNPRVDAAFTFAADERTRYGNNAFGNACLTARNLLRAQLGTRFIQISIGSWDNHSSIYQGGALNPSNTNSIARQFDTGLGNLITDLKNDGTLNDTLIFCMGEFGRTVGAPNTQAGRDHYLQESVMFAGAGINGLKVIGATDSLGSATADPGWSRARDIRPEDIEATIYSALGIDYMTVRHDDPLGRGFEYVPQSSTDNIYGPVNELWS